MIVMRFLGAALGALLAVGVLATGAFANELKAANPQPAADKLKPGLAVVYYYAMFENVKDIAKLGKGKAGPPIATLDHKADMKPVLTSETAMGVGAQIAGFIKFAAAGKHTLKILSNDGVKLAVGGAVLHEDPGVHSDTWSPALEVNVPQPGWYPLAIDYFQKKGTSALRLVWTAPGGKEEVVPASAYAHIPK